MSSDIIKSGPATGPDFEETSELPPPGAGGRSGRGGNGTSGAPAAGAYAAPVPPRRVIAVGVDEHRVVDEAAAALAAHEDVYVRGGILVRIVCEQPLPSSALRGIGAPRIAPISYYGVRDLLTASADWVKYVTDRNGNESEKLVHPPDWAVGEVDARGEWPGMRPLEGVTESPVLRADGTVLDAPGYDRDTGLLYIPNATFKKVRAKPTREHALKAKAKLLEVVEDFPFATEAGRAGWVAAVLTLFARPGFSGPAPMFVLDANTPGTGKGLLADATALIVEGRPVPPTPQAENDGEERKLITAAAMEGARIVMFDNLTRPLGSGALEAVLTSTRWRDRVLGISKTFVGDVYTVWMATGNNVAFRKRDTIRRTVHIRLETELQDPESRRGFQHPELRSWVLANRPTLVAAAVTILRAYCAAGRPDMKLPPWGSFDGWSALVRNAVVWVGLDDPAKTRDELARTADTELTSLADLLTGWDEMCAHVAHSSGGCTAAMALEALGKDEAESRMQVRGLRFAPLRSALAELISTPPGKLPTATRVGALLRGLRGRVVDGRKLAKGLRGGDNFWFVVAAAAGADGGDGGLGGGVSGDPGGTKEDLPGSTGSTPRPRNDPADVHHVHHVHPPAGHPEAAGGLEQPGGEAEREVFDL